MKVTRMNLRENSLAKTPIAPLCVAVGLIIVLFVVVFASGTRAQFAPETCSPPMCAVTEIMNTADRGEVLRSWGPRYAPAYNQIRFLAYILMPVAFFVVLFATKMITARRSGEFERGRSEVDRILFGFAAAAFAATLIALWMGADFRPRAGTRDGESDWNHLSVVLFFSSVGLVLASYAGWYACLLLFGMRQKRDQVYVTPDYDKPPKA